MRKGTFALFSFLFFVSLIAAAQVKLETAGPLKDADASSEILKAVQTQGHRVLADGKTSCEIWLASSFPGAATRAESASAYRLTPGQFVGVISFPHGASDFRGQAIKPGPYSLRYELMPEDGNHLGVAPGRDFLLLVPLAKDASTTTMTSAALLAASAAVTGTNHPAVFMLTSLPKEPLPRAYETPAGYVVFAGKAGDVGLALVVKGQAEQ